MNEMRIIHPPRVKITAPDLLYFPFDPYRKIIGQKLEEIAIAKYDLRFTTVYALEKWMVMYQGIGAPVAGMGLECLIHSGVKRVLLLGVCGSFKPDDEIGQAILITQAIRSEGTSLHYFPHQDKFRPSSPWKKMLAEFLESNNLPYSLGTIVSTDAPHRETPSWIKTMQNKGINYVDMETSAVMAISHFYQLEAAALHLVSDIVTSQKWIPGFKSPILEEKIKQYFFPFLERNFPGHEKKDGEKTKINSRGDSHET